MNLTPIRVKANAHYQCQECGSTELIHAHHELPGYDNSIIALCAECHSKRHPTVPKALFFNKGIQPYWNNKSASSLAKEWGLHSRTVIRAAKRLKIPNGELSPFDKELIENNIPKLNRRPEALAKHDALLEIERNQLLRDYVELHPELSLKEVGNIFNISESRVWRILHSDGSKGKVNSGKH